MKLGISTRTFAVVIVLATFAFVHPACVGNGGEGDRCNPNLSHDECDNGLVCVQPGACPEAYCCPVNASASSSAYCRGDPSVCPSEAGTGDDGGGEAATDASADSPGDSHSE
jgi:hypothetical protein